GGRFGHNFPAAHGPGRQSLVFGVVLDNEVADFIRRSPNDRRRFEHGVAAGATVAVVIDRDAEFLIVGQWLTVIAQVADALAYRLPEIDFILDAGGHVVVVTDDAFIDERTGSAIAGTAKEEV